MGNRGQIRLAPYSIWCYTHWGGASLIKNAIAAIESCGKNQQGESLAESLKTYLIQLDCEDYDFIVQFFAQTDVFYNIIIDSDRKTVQLLYDFIDSNPEQLFLGTFENFIKTYKNGIGWDEENRSIKIDGLFDGGFDFE